MRRVARRLPGAAGVVFLSNLCIMVIELVAGRLLAPLVGVSLYSWTSVIAVVLAGISLGNILGGRMADRAASRLLLGRLFFAGSLATLAVLALIPLAYLIPLRLPIPLYVLLVTMLVFFLPGLLLGTISPVVLKLALHSLAGSGQTVGTLFAASALGTVVGTFLTGFWLVSHFPTRPILLGVALLLLLTGAVVVDWTTLSRRERQRSLLVAGSLAAAIVAAFVLVLPVLPMS